MLNLFRKFLHEKSGATMVEYGIMVALIAALCVAVVFLLGQYTNGGFIAVGAKVKAVGTVSPSAGQTIP